jgi:hypothetical protein
MIDRLARLTEVFEKHKIRYLFIGKGVAILYGYPGTTQDIDIFPEKTEGNCQNLVKAGLIGWQIIKIGPSPFRSITNAKSSRW